MATNTLDKVSPYIEAYGAGVTTWVNRGELKKTRQMPLMVPGSSVGNFKNQILGERGVKKYDKDDVIDFAIMVLMIVQKNKTGSFYGLWLKIKQEFLTKKVEYSALATGLDVCTNCQLFQGVINKYATDIAAAKDPPHFMLAVLDKMIVGAVKSIPVIGTVAHETGAFFTDKLITTLWSNVIAEPATMLVGDAVGGKAGVATAISAFVDAWQAKKLKEEVKNCQKDNSTFTAKINAANLNRHEADLAISELTTGGMDKQSAEIMKDSLSGVKKILGKSDAKKTTQGYYKASADVIRYFGMAFPFMVEKSIFAAYKDYIDKLKARVDVLDQHYPGTKQRVISPQMDDAAFVVAIICGYFVKQSYIQTSDKVAPEYAFIFQCQRPAGGKHDYVDGEHWYDARVSPKDTDKLAKTDAYGSLKYAFDTTLDMKNENYLSNAAFNAEKMLGEIRQNVQHTLNAGFKTGINDDELHDCVKLVITCAVICNEVDYMGTGNREIKIPDVRIKTLSDLGWVNAYSKSFGSTGDKKKLTVVDGVFKLRYPFESSGTFFSMAAFKAEASHKEFAMLYMFCLYVVNNVDFVMLLLGYSKWKDIKEELRNLINKLNGVTDDQLEATIRTASAVKRANTR